MHSSELPLIAARGYCFSQGSNVNPSRTQFSPTVTVNFCIATVVISNMHLSQEQDVGWYGMMAPGSGVVLAAVVC